MKGEVKVKPLVWVATEVRNRNDYHGSPEQITKYVSNCRKYTLICNWNTGGSWDAYTGTWDSRHRIHLSSVNGATCVKFSVAKAAADADNAKRVMGWRQ